MIKDGKTFRAETAEDRRDWLEATGSGDLITLTINELHAGSTYSDPDEFSTIYLTKEAAEALGHWLLATASARSN